MTTTMIQSNLNKLPILIGTVGLPFSGKSEWAKSQGLLVISLEANEKLIKEAIAGKNLSGEKLKEQVKKFTKQLIETLFLSGNRAIILLAENLTKKERDFWRNDSEWQTFFREFKVTELEAIRAATQAGASKATLDQIKIKAKAYEPLSPHSR